MRKTTNYRLALYDVTDKMVITANEDSLNHNMELIDNALKEKATINDMTNYIEEHKEELKGADGKDGVNGADGKDGYTPIKGVDYFDGKDGINGTNGIDGKDGANGNDGVSATHSWNGTTLTITSASGTSSADLKGEKGEQGIQGEKGADGKDGYTPVKGIDYFDGKDGVDGINGIDGKNGTNGVDGQDGYSPTAKVETTSTGATITITDKNGTTTTTITNGKDGATGSKGDDGYTPIKGTDYWTENDKNEIKEYVKEEIPTKTSELTNDSGFLTEVELTEEQLNEIADKVADAQKIEIVDSIGEMTDISKSYCLSTDGYIYTYKNVTTEETNTYRDDIDKTGYIDQTRFTSSMSEDSFTTGSSQNGYHVTSIIDLTKNEYKNKVIKLHLEGAHYCSTGTSETWIQCRIYQNNESKSIINPRAITCDTPLASSILSYTNGISITYNNETSCIFTITMPPSYGAVGTEIGYLRFCGRGTIENSNIYITYEKTETVTREQWVNTGIKFVDNDGSGGIDEETLAKIFELNNEGNDPTTIKLLTKPVLDFYNAEAYPDDDYTITYLQKYTYPYRADIPVPYTVKWNYNEDAMRTTVAVDIKNIGTVNRFTMFTYDATGLNKYPLYNLIPNKRYYYKVIHILFDGSIVEAKSGSFTTSNETIRFMYIEGTQNVRDLGGWTGLNGKTVKYGKIFRGASLSDSSFADLMLTGKGRLTFAELNVQAELNLGAVDNETSIASNCAYKKVGYSNYATAFTDATAKANFKTVLEFIVSCLDGTYTQTGLSTIARNIYMHCQGGCDRTGTLSFQLLGLLGVSESDLAKEYELSSFSDIGLGRLRTTTKAVDTYDYVGMVEAIKTYNGTTITDKFYDFAVNGCGVSETTITSFRNLMLE